VLLRNLNYRQLGDDFLVSGLLLRLCVLETAFLHDSYKVVKHVSSTHTSPGPTSRSELWSKVVFKHTKVWPESPKHVVEETWHWIVIKSTKWLARTWSCPSSKSTACKASEHVWEVKPVEELLNIATCRTSALLSHPKHPRESWHLRYLLLLRRSTLLLLLPWLFLSCRWGWSIGWSACFVLGVS
jgi:hypothetical protein